MQTLASHELLKITGELASSHRSMRPRPSCLQRSKILIVDDDADLGELLRLILEQAGYRNVECITDPVGVIDFVQEWKPDLVVLDLLMPGADGLKVLRALRHLVPDKPLLPILIVSGDPATETQREALECGGNDFVAKPYETRDMVARIGHFLETRFLYREQLTARCVAAPPWAQRLPEALPLQMNGASAQGLPGAKIQDSTLRGGHLARFVIAENEDLDRR